MKQPIDFQSALRLLNIEVEEHEKTRAALAAEKLRVIELTGARDYAVEAGRRNAEEIAALKERAEKAERCLAGQHKAQESWCAYCGSTNPAATLEDIRAHIDECPKHPLTEVRAQLAESRAEAARLRAEAAQLRAAIEFALSAYEQSEHTVYGPTGRGWHAEAKSRLSNVFYASPAGKEAIEAVRIAREKLEYIKEHCGDPAFEASAGNALAALDKAGLK